MKSANFLLIYVLSLLVLATGTWFLLIPQLKSASQAQAKVEQLRRDLAQEQVQPIKPLALTASATATQAQTLLPATDNQYDLAVQIDSLSHSLNLPLASLSLVSDATTPGKSGVPPTPSPNQPTSLVSTSFKKVTISLSVSASYTDIQRFIQGLTSLNRLIQIDQVNIALPSESSSTGTGGAGTVAPATSTGQLTAQIVAFALYQPAKSK